LRGHGERDDEAGAAGVGLDDGAARLRLADLHSELPDAAGEVDLEADDAAGADAAFLDLEVVEGARQQPGVYVHVCQVLVDMHHGSVDGALGGRGDCWRRPGDPRRLRGAQRIIEEVANLTDLDEQFRQPSLPLMRGWLAATQGDLDRAMANLRPLDAAAESRDVLALVARLDCGPLRDRDCGA